MLLTISEAIKGKRNRTIFSRLTLNDIVITEREENGHRWTLQIRHFGPRQTGKYCAMARNRSGTCRKTWNLQPLVIAEKPAVGEKTRQKTRENQDDESPIIYRMEDKNQIPLVLSSAPEKKEVRKNRINPQ